MSQSDYLQFKKNAMMWSNLSQYPRTFNQSDYLQLKSFAVYNMVPNQKPNLTDNRQSMISSSGNTLLGSGGTQTILFDCLRVNDLCLSYYPCKQYLVNGDTIPNR